MGWLVFVGVACPCPTPNATSLPTGAVPLTMPFSLPVFAYSPMGMPFTLNPPFGIGLNLFLFAFASAAILYPVWPFVVAAFRAIRSGVANMAVLVILSVGTG